MRDREPIAMNFEIGRAVGRNHERFDASENQTQNPCPLAELRMRYFRRGGAQIGVDGFGSRVAFLQIGRRPILRLPMTQRRRLFGLGQATRLPHHRPEMDRSRKVSSVFLFKLTLSLTFIRP